MSSIFTLLRYYPSSFGNESKTFRFAHSSGSKSLMVVLAVVAVGLCGTSLTSGAPSRIAEKLAAAPIMGESLDGRPGRRIDAVFVLDATGSMITKAEFVKRKVLALAHGMLETSPRPDVRLGLVFYRDRSEEFVAKIALSLSRDLYAFRDSLRTLNPLAGGWDRHEDVASALATAIYKIDWDKDRNTERRIYLVGDAPPHPEYTDAPDVADLAVTAATRGLVVSTVACSVWGELVGSWRMIAAITGGEFSFLVPGERVFGATGPEVRTAFGDGADIFIMPGEVTISSWEDLDEFVSEGRLIKAAPGDIAEGISWKGADSLDRYLAERLAPRTHEE